MQPERNPGHGHFWTHTSLLAGRDQSKPFRKPGGKGWQAALFPLYAAAAVQKQTSPDKFDL